MPRQPRYLDTGKSTFFGDMVYQRIIPQDHFLVALNKLFPWEEMSAELIQVYRGQGVMGHRPYNPVQIFKMLFISYLYGVSEHQVEELVNFHLVVKWFVGLAVDEPAPDHSTLTRFKNRYLQDDQWELLAQSFTWIVDQARALGLEMGPLQVVDSTHTQADVNADKEDKRQKQGQPPPRWRCGHGEQRPARGGRTRWPTGPERATLPGLQDPCLGERPDRDHDQFHLYAGELGGQQAVSRSAGPGPSVGSAHPGLWGRCGL